jgi:type I restriction enzyme S subunit
VTRGLDDKVKLKDSGVSWIGMVPVGWGVSKVRNHFIITKRIAGRTGFDVISITQQGLKIKDIESNQGQMAKDYSKYQIVEPGDFAMNHMDLLTGYIGIASGYGVTSPDYRVFKLLDENANFSRYFLYIFQQAYERQIYYGLGKGAASKGRWRLPAIEFLNYDIPVPPRPEQDAIVAYLDDKTAKIDRLIGLYKREIELLKERRQAVIHKAVTRGLDDKVKLKDSGVSWIGMVPVGWGVSSVGRLYSAFLGKMLEQSSNFSQPNSEYKPYICAKDVHFDGVDITDSKLMKFNKQEIQKYSVKRGDLLIVEGGAGAGGSAIYNYDDERMVQNSIHVVRSRGFLLNRYLYYWMYSLVSRDYIDAVCNKATIPHFTVEKLTATMIPLPPRPEQDDIVAYLDDQCAKIDAMIGKVQSKIGLLEEYRVRLISDVVTGKVRV